MPFKQLNNQKQFLVTLEKALKVAVVVAGYTAVSFALPPPLCHLLFLFLFISISSLCPLYFLLSLFLCHFFLFINRFFLSLSLSLSLYLAFLFFFPVFVLSFCPSPFAGLNSKKSLLKFGGHYYKRKVQATFLTPRHIFQKYAPCPLGWTIFHQLNIFLS